jgi:hypothetical protein
MELKYLTNFLDKRLGEIEKLELTFAVFSTSCENRGRDRGTKINCGLLSSARTNGLS